MIVDNDNSEHEYYCREFNSLSEMLTYLLMAMYKPCAEMASRL